MALTRTKTKTLYTPVFKPTPPTSTSSSSSSSSSYIARHHKPHSALTPNAYLNRLSRAHIGLALVEDVPSSRPGSPSDADTEVDSALKRRIVQYIQDAGGNPADGNWSLISENLKMPCTAGSNGRYMGVRRADNDGNDHTPAAVFDLLNADTEQKWFEWLKKMEVERWAGGVEVPSVEHEHSVVSDSEGTKVSAHEAPSGTTTATNDPISVSSVKISLAPVKGDALSPEELSLAKTNSRRSATVAIVAPPLEDYDLKDPSPLGFPVVKSTSRSSLTGKPKPGIKRGAEQDKKAESNAKAPKEKPEDTNRPNTEPKSKSNPKPISISDISETVFLPPSFPSHLITSTPHPDPIRVKPPPIPRASSSAQRMLSSSIQTPLSAVAPHPSTPRHNSNPSIMPPPSPSPKRISGRAPKPNAETMSSSLPELPSSSSIIEPLSTPTRDPKKRARSSLDAGGGSEPSLKKARTTPLSLFTVRPHHQEKKVLPPSSSPRTPAPAPAVAVDVLSSTRPKRTLPTLTELLASSKKMKQAKVKSRMQQKEDVQSRDRGGDSALQGVRQNSEEELVSVPDHDRNRKETEQLKEKGKEKSSSNPNPNIFAEKTQYSPIPGLNAHLHPSPTKSLSSIAGSDSEDSDDEQAPMFADGLGLGTAFTQDPNRFRPDLVSTQLGREKSGSVDMDLVGHSQSHSQSQTEGVPKGSSGIFGYNSQYDVNREVDLVSGILGKEVDLNEWLRDVSDDDEDD